MRNKSNAILQFSSLIMVITALSCASPKTTAYANQTGENFERAIVVDAVEAEHRWINEHYPNARVLVQEVVQQSGRPYDVITIRTEEEARKTFYFDISRFYKKK